MEGKHTYICSYKTSPLHSWNCPTHLFPELEGDVNLVDLLSRNYGTYSLETSVANLWSVSLVAAGIRGRVKQGEHLLCISIFTIRFFKCNRITRLPKEDDLKGNKTLVVSLIFILKEPHLYW